MIRRRLLVTSVILLIAATSAGCGIGGELRPTRLDDVDLPQEPVPEEAGPDDDGPATVVYFVRGELLEPVERPVPSTVADAMRSLFEGPRETESEGGLRTAIPAGTELLDATVGGGVATVDLSTGFTAVVGPEQVLALAQLVYTATSVAGVSSVRFAIDGHPIDAARGDGSLAPGTVSRADYPGASAG